MVAHARSHGSGGPAWRTIRPASPSASRAGTQSTRTGSPWVSRSSAAWFAALMFTRVSFLLVRERDDLRVLRRRAVATARGSRARPGPRALANEAEGDHGRDASIAARARRMPQRVSAPDVA